MSKCNLNAVKFVILLQINLIAISLSAPIDNNHGNALITKYEFNKKDNGEHHYEYETSDGQTKSESGQIILTEDGNTELFVSGSYSYIGDNRIKYIVNYSAGRNGFVFNQTYRPIVAEEPVDRSISSHAQASLIGTGIG